AGRNVHDLHGLVFRDAAGFQQVAADGNGALVVDVLVRQVDAVNLPGQVRPKQHAVAFLDKRPTRGARAGRKRNSSLLLYGIAGLLARAGVTGLAAGRNVKRRLALARQLGVDNRCWPWRRDLLYRASEFGLGVAIGKEVVMRWHTK